MGSGDPFVCFLRKAYKEFTFLSIQNFVFFMYAKLVFIFYVFAFFCCFSFIASEKSYASDGTFTISSPMYSNPLFDWLADSFSPSMSFTTVFCYLYLNASLVSTNSSCNPFEPTFIYNPPDGDYHIRESIGSSTWVSSPSAYVALTPTETPPTTPTASPTPVYVDIATTSALAIGLHDEFANIQLAEGLAIFVLILTLIFFMIRSIW